MERIKLASGLSLSRIVHGEWRLSDWKYTDEELIQLIEHCLDQGITTFDHADLYGSYTCEELFGRALAKKPELRERMEIVTKCGIVIESPNRPEHHSHHYNTSKAHIKKSVENSLENLRTDYIDLLLIHRPDPFMDPGEVASAFRELKDEGKVRHFGVSNFKQHQLNMLQSFLDVELVTNQIELSAYNLENIQDGTLDLCMEKRMAPMAWSPLGGGDVFTSQEEKAVRLRGTLEKVANELGADGIDEVLYAWLLNHPANIMPIVGSGKVNRIDRAVAALDYNLSRDQWFEIYTSSMGYDIP
ncbi:oxidoreductase [Pontibacillus yanchengensis]|uniref:Oxidoreductase n=2 Tax=Pontibacillus yanchengensis TaxID=462910 RepID=A0A6I5A7E0_9BACI|nr:aldo/keto reductase family oxidoreductase [Pontibacillus yanchengensis]MYL36062.1 oxidoreductase [Pontibacillus yanchengensis]MYL54358.1 oxidoreductase [Pontibacillus yanchengensis]